MNQIILNLMIINSTASIVYILYKIYISKNDDLVKLINDKDILEKYNTRRRTSITFYILGALLGLIILILMDNDNNTIGISKKIVSDVSDIYVK